jgi:CelD/BcsL family acetyltransferase involved in cellulose biosynthesis
MEGTASPAMVEQAVEVRVLRSLAELEEIRPYWESWPGHPESRMDFYLSLLRSTPDIVRPHVLAVYRDGRPESILIGRVDRRPIRFRVGYFSVRFKANSLFFVKGSLRGDGSLHDCELLIRELCRNLSSGEADLAYLNFLQEDSDIYRLAKELPGILSRDRIRTSQRHYTVKLPGSVEEFHKSLSPRIRKNKRWKKLDKDFAGAVQIKCFQTVSELGSLVEVAEAIAQRTYQRGLGVGFANTSQERQRLQLKAEKGWLRGYVLYLRDRPAAFWIGDMNQGVLGGDYVGFDPVFGEYSPGMYLMFKVIEGFCAGSENVAGVDFATGSAEYKEALSNCVWDETEVYIFAPSFKGIALNVVKTSAAGIDKALKSFLERTGFLQKVKKAWRGRMAHARAPRNV